jgi:hypothetical protein
MPLPLPQAGDPGRGAVRCSNCMLLVGPGRAVGTRERAGLARGAAVGWVSSRARHDESGDGASAPAIGVAIRSVAGALEAPVERLRMTDYQRRAAEDEDLPALADIYSTFGTWKSARSAAAAEAKR